MGVDMLLTYLTAPLALSLYFGLVQQAQCSRPCYFPDGTPAINVIPCNSTQEESMCCVVGSTCLSIGICLSNQDITDPNNIIGDTWRGSCTDSLWHSPFCPQFCNQDPNNKAGAQPMSSCRQQKWCCQDGSNLTSCCGDDSVFQLDHASPVANLVATTSASAVSPTAETLQSPIKSTMMSKSVTTTAETGSTSTQNQPMVSIHDATLPINSLTGSKPPSPPSKKPTSAFLGLSIGLGVFIIITMLVAGACITNFKYRRKQKNRHQHSDGKAFSHQPSNPALIGSPKVELGPTAWELPASSTTAELPDHKTAAGR